MRSEAAAKKALSRALTLLTVVSVLFLPIKAFAADEIKLGVLSISAEHWPLWVAEAKGYFKEMGLDVRQFHTNSVAKSEQALAAGSTDLLFPANTEGTVTAMVKGARIKIIAGDYTKAIYDLIAGPQYKKVEDLKGKTIGVINLASGSTVLLMKIMSAHGLKYPGDYSLLTVGGTPSRFAAVKNGAVAAAMVTIPISFEAKEAGLNVLANISTYLPNYQFTVIAGNDDWLASHRDVTVRFLEAIIKGMRFLNDKKNKEEAIDILVKYDKISHKYAEMAYTLVEEQIKPIDSNAAPNIKGIDEVIKEEVERKAFNKMYPASKFLDNSYRMEALKRLGE